MTAERAVVIRSAPASSDRYHSRTVADLMHAGPVLPPPAPDLVSGNLGG
jgi:hypothetical protein